jgi:hypothetical protein
VEGAPVFTGEHTAGFDRLPAPAVKPEDPVGLRDSLPALEIGEFTAMRLTGSDVGTVRLTPQRLYLLC